jgi:hypothetical protein
VTIHFTTSLAVEVDPNHTLATVSLLLWKYEKIGTDQNPHFYRDLRELGEGRESIEPLDYGETLANLKVQKPTILFLVIDRRSRIFKRIEPHQVFVSILKVQKTIVLKGE